MNNNIYNINDSLVVKIKPKQNGITTLNSFVDSIIGITSDRKVLREFRIIENELFYTDWKELTEESIVGKRVNKDSYIEVRYTRKGEDTSGVITFESIEFFGDFEEKTIYAPIIDKSIFSDIAWNEETEILAKNLFEKLYFRGIIPKYILRGDNVNYNEDEDYITFFYTISKFFAIIFRFFKRFENFNNDYDLMLEWIKQNNIQINEDNTSLEQLQYIASHLYDEIRRRGTKMIFNREGESLNGVTNEIDGEFVRLIGSKKDDELLYEYMTTDLIGWCLGKSSPMYRGTSFSKFLNKTKENTKDFQNINNYQTFSTENSVISIEEVENKKVLKLRANSSCGLGRIDKALSKNKLIPVDVNLDYEITFMLKITSSSNGAKLHFGLDTFNNNKSEIYDALTTPDNIFVTNWFTEECELNNFIENEWYLVRGIIHGYRLDQTNNSKLNIGVGQNLKFNSRFVKYILPNIYITSDNGESSVYLYDYKIRPLVRGINSLTLNNEERSHSLGFIQSSRIFYVYFKNNNNCKSEGDITSIIEKYLLPFNVVNILQFINNK